MSHPPIEVPFEALAEDTLQAVIESFVMREGTDYGWREVSLADKVFQLRQQLESGELKLVFDGESESVTLMTTRDFIRGLGKSAEREDPSEPNLR